ncbi:hypothetical protein KQH49_08590 [Mycetohabitans sp. B5]|uniref:Uncharacterized protein n=1 Tax=Mycetohabitans endofungorum TaxID=417203 RepID=A0A2P5KAF7_9BURK|nr:MULTISPECIES: hypothetical protein [Mycetohabitans]MCG1055006.1 hypothetical protein [Mycetohabitans sp. B5]PPB83683.1 hypothetical protein B0O95_10674 [Mycetohabitans endofungorum]
MLEGLGYHPSCQIPMINTMTRRTKGINIISGLTGAIKSTTLECVAQRPGLQHSPDHN